jgi:hypothetical protein
VDIEDAIPALPQVGLVTEGMDTDVEEVIVKGQPGLRPVVVWLLRVGPCFPTSPAQSVYEDNVGNGVCRLRWLVECVQAKVTLVIIDIERGKGSGERG